MTDHWNTGYEMLSGVLLTISRLFVNGFSKIDRATFAAIFCPSHRPDFARG